MKMKRHSYSIIYWKNKAKGLLELPTCKDDPVDLMPQVKGRTHVVGLEDMPRKKKRIEHDLTKAALLERCLCS